MKFINRIKGIVKARFDLIDNEKLKKNILNAFPFWLGAFIAGIVAVFYAKLFSWAESGAHFIFERANWSLFILAPVCFVLAWWIVIKFAPYSRGSGIPQVSAAIELSNPKHNYKVNKLLSIRVAFVKIISSLVLVFGGGVIGREGPTIQISASIFKKINDLLPSWYPKISRQNMVITGAAAGLAAAFNTPLGGIVFAIEELTKVHFSFFKSALLTGVIIAGLTALVFLGPYLYLGYPQLTGISAWILLAIIPLALITGLLGSIMGDIILYIFKKKRGIKKNYQKIIYAAICGLVIAALAFFIDARTLGSGKEIMVTTLFTDDKKVLWYVPFLRIIGPIVTFSIGASGGIFAPSLSAGASIGAVLANMIHLSGPATNLLILCGMAGFLTSVTRSPFTSCILVLEMTNTHNVIFYIMISTLLANLVATMVNRHSFYDQLKDQYLGEILKEDTQPTETPPLKEVGTVNNS